MTSTPPSFSRSVNWLGGGGGGLPSFTVRSDPLSWNGGERRRGLLDCWVCERPIRTNEQQTTFSPRPSSAGSPVGWGGANSGSSACVSHPNCCSGLRSRQFLGLRPRFLYPHRCNGPVLWWATHSGGFSRGSSPEPGVGHVSWLTWTCSVHVIWYCE